MASSIAVAAPAAAVQHRVIILSSARAAAAGCTTGAMAAAHHLLASRGLVGVLRAHQHNNAPDTGPMLDRVTAAGGAYDNWNRSGHVVTFLSGAHIPG